MDNEYLYALQDKIEYKLQSMDSQELLSLIVEQLRIHDTEEFVDLADTLRDCIINYHERIGKLRNGNKQSKMPELAEALDIDYTEQDYECECKQEQAELEQQNIDYERAVKGK